MAASIVEHSLVLHVWLEIEESPYCLFLECVPRDSQLPHATNGDCMTGFLLLWGVHWRFPVNRLFLKSHKQIPGFSSRSEAMQHKQLRNRTRKHVHQKLEIYLCGQIRPWWSVAWLHQEGMGWFVTLHYRLSFPSTTLPVCWYRGPSFAMPAILMFVFRCKINWKKGKNVTVKTMKKKQKHKGERWFPHWGR